MVAWCIRCHSYNVIFENMSALKGHIINLAAKIFEDMRFYNVVSDILDKDRFAGTQVNLIRYD